MLQDMRKSTQGTAAKIVVGLIVIAFSMFGIESILLGGGGSGVAEVNGEEISPQELQQAVNTQKRRLISMMGDSIDPAMLDDQLLSGQALDSLINRKLLMQSANEMKLSVSERQIGAIIGGMEQFQVDGQFSPDAYKSLLSSAGYTPAYFKQNLRDDITLTQLRSGLAGSEFATPSELAINARVTAEQRDLRYLTIPMEKFSTNSDISEAEIEAFYAENQSSFLTSESVDLEYIELNRDDFRQPVEESLVLEAYEQAKQNPQYKTENRVYHILFETTDDDSQRQRIADAQAQLASGAEFADVAREFSDDVGSAGSGGDLGYSGGDAFPEEMEQAIAQLELNVVSDPVQTDAGKHLIMVTERNEGKVADLEDMRAELEETIQADEARIVLLRTVEALRDLAFNADGLDSPAGELDLAVQQAEGVTRAQPEGLFANPSLTTAAFSEDVLEAGHNSDVIELGGDRFVVMRVRRYNEPQVKPLDSVREQIVADIAESSARAAVAAKAEQALQALRSGVSLETLAKREGYEWQVELGANRANTAVPGAVLQRAFELPVPAEGESASDYIMTQVGDAQVFELVRVSAGDYKELAETEQQALRQQVSAEYSNLVDTEFQRGLRSDAEINVL